MDNHDVECKDDCKCPTWADVWAAHLAGSSTPFATAKENLEKKQKSEEST